ncbi:C39 family peptidase [Terribacillus saccharophilus]|uniref:C39 family peptidase n=1 Tax=Terribacillus saccharophilus TaxID=361277 RepID=UPI00381E14F2
MSKKESSHRKLITTYTILYSIGTLSLSTYNIYDSRNYWIPTVEDLFAQGKKISEKVMSKDITLHQERQLDNEKKVQDSLRIKDDVSLDVPLLSQFPELPRGCEVTSLAMLLQYYGYNTDKLKLAQEIFKDETKYQEINGKVHFGNPNTGYVGNMYTYNEKGYGVYNGPIEELAKRYASTKVINLTGRNFEEVILQVSNGRPVWVITNTTFKELPEAYFETWHTKKGEIKITMKEHSVVVTGYDNKFVYFNDPITGKKGKATIKDFTAAWIQMGKQAITINNN